MPGSRPARPAMRAALPGGYRDGHDVDRRRARRRTDSDRRLVHTVGLHGGARARHVVRLSRKAQGVFAHHYRQRGDRRAGGVRLQGDGGAVAACRTALRPGPRSAKVALAAWRCSMGKVVHFLSCATRMFRRGDGRERAGADYLERPLELLKRAIGYDVVVPEHTEGQRARASRYPDRRAFRRRAERVGVQDAGRDRPAGRRW